MIAFHRRKKLPIKKCEAKAAHGFTLVEMLVVLAIIGLLVALVGPRVLSELGSAKVKSAQIQIDNFKSALDLFYLDMGRYPTTTEGLDALETRPENAENWGGPYLKGGSVPRDPWNNAYVYRAPGDEGRPYKIISHGPPSSGADTRKEEIISR